MSEISYKKSIEFCQAIKDGVRPEVIERLWYSTFSAVLQSFGFNDGDNIVFLWNNLVQGNWKRLHMTDDEKQITKDEWLDRFWIEVFYCSDRWSFDRLMRCHWFYRAWRGEY